MIAVKEALRLHWQRCALVVAVERLLTSTGLVKDAFTRLWSESLGRIVVSVEAEHELHLLK